MTKQDLEFSIVIPTYNEEEDIRATLEACVALKYPRKEIIVVDDSNDRTPDIVREYKNDGDGALRQDLEKYAKEDN